MSEEKRIDSLTGIRGIAALLVVYAHLAEDRFFAISPLHPGEIGVMVFFTLSGFLMAFLYGDKPFNYSAAIRYGVARFSRIAPAYLTVVLISYLIYNLVDSNFIYAITHQNLARHLAFSGNVSALWSIPPEVQFYIVFLGLWLALWTFGSRGDAAPLVLALVVIFTLIAYRGSLPGTFVGSKIHYFFVGVVFGLVRSHAAAGVGLKTFSCLQGLALVLIALVVTDSFHMDFGSKREFYLDLLPALFAGAFIFVFSFDTSFSKRLLGNRLLAMCGECSFSMYLLNIPVIYVAIKIFGNTSGRTPLLAAGTFVLILVAAWAMYRLVELPGNRLLRKLGTRLLLDRYATNKQPQRPAMSALVVPLAGDAGEKQGGGD
ncbi:acyltransferase [Xanthomonas hortorum pv. gardneri]|uniref:acyltransferase family protein n=1 Tax=Xanthomonas hortorum TaxID=56454 RepID=UPI001E2F5F78|nr:acyltransferase [Xanthomonas hortorum]MCC8495808.1 acyltransferase [Xanthomonas hortorum pv. gardneri]MCE4530231.1 acyltransferase [Xanthomonas hortorum pv. vitians]